MTTVRDTSARADVAPKPNGAKKLNILDMLDGGWDTEQRTTVESFPQTQSATEAVATPSWAA